ncbi:putative protein phosphatase regulator PIG2 NDAI_0A02620 [Naumovozyma dairenensis CBS 421]|uniref:CBM21 domain-containing protein n=1 Tax=Naumovozyma dairenensis (strain ATCC 10597 / BCRC 20456 / CBS 421 / NBRC 0211 / NRRL Y-12639) TaxID=1071378 RepID=G0W3N2_NAUDC|nr:hypothetical protein NDAI_0A02620 [Naumovozyma dairenensis CBS 421]CCD22420.1 hypothetical protein NDAI_0A02620 [Naumovozyma dairenensis CBS 421]
MNTTNVLGHHADLTTKRPALSAHAAAASTTAATNSISNSNSKQINTTNLTIPSSSNDDRISTPYDDDDAAGGISPTSKAPPSPSLSPSYTFNKGNNTPSRTFPPMENFHILNSKNIAIATAFNGSNINNIASPIPDFNKSNSRSNINYNITSNSNSSSNSPTPSQLPFNSLSFLHKPKRVSQMKMNNLPKEQLERNTNMNKDLQSNTNYSSNTTTFPGYQQLPSPPLTDNTFSPSYYKNSYYFNDTEPTTTTSKEEEEEYDGISPLTKSKIPPTTNGISEQSTLDYYKPVYKKSGELLKPSLKRRSQSLPITPNHSILNMKGKHPSNNKGMMINGRIQLSRSKSVHFDNKLPTKYFSKDESPIIVSASHEETNILNFKPKPLQRSVCYEDGEDVEDEEGEEDVSSRKKKSLKKLLNLSDDDEDDDHDDDNDERTDGIFNLRLEKLILNDRHSSISKSTPIRTKKKYTADNDSDEDDGKIRDYENGLGGFVTFNPPVTNGKTIVGLYNRNFPILSNKNPKSLKLNIFVNYSRGKKVFLQDLNLHIQHDYVNNGHSLPSQTATLKNKYIMGRVLVENIYFDKNVVVRYTWDHWNSFQEIQAIFVSNAKQILPGSNMDVFKFLIDDVNKFDNKCHLEFCIQYVTRNDTERKEFWDNNDNKNYTVDVVLDGFKNPFANTII